MPELEETTEEARIYEICILYPHPLNQKEEQDFFKEVEEVFQEAGAKQVAKDVWGRRGLAYPIGGHSEGAYVVYHYEMDPAKVKGVDETLRITPNVLRHIVVKPPKGYEVSKFSEKYEEWLKERETAEETRRKKKEEALQKKVADRAKRKVKKVEETKKEAPVPKKTSADEQELSEQLEKIISDEDLDI